MKNKNTPPVGIYGGETNGANPLEWNLRSTICAQLRTAGYYCTMDVFGDKSASWVSVYRKGYNPDIKTPDVSFLHIVIAFNIEGSVITEIKMFEESFSLVSNGTKLIW